MTKRSLGILAVAAAALVLLAVLAQRSESPADVGSALLFPGLMERLNDVERVAVVRAGDEAVATLERSEAGWTVAERQGYPADTGKLRQALIALAEARLVERKTATPSLHDRIGVEDVDGAEAAGLALDVTGGGDWPTLILGDAEGAGQRYVRRADEVQSYLIDRNPDLPRNTSQWLAPAIVDVPGTRVQQVTITHPGGEVVRVYKDSREQTNFNVADVPEGRALQYAGVANVIGNSLRGLNLEDVERAAEPPTEAVTVAEFRTFDGLVIEMRGFERDDAPWIELTASLDPAPAEPFAPETGGDAAEANGAAAGETAAAPATEPEDEAAAIAARTAGWRYRIASYQFDQMTRTLEDLLEAPAEDPAEAPAEQ